VVGTTTSEERPLEWCFIFNKNALRNRFVYWLSPPRGAFLGLCEAGVVKGILAGHYTASKDNKAYAVGAAALLTEGTQSWSTSALWQAVSNDPKKTHNGQMDIVLALWKNDLIVRNS
jgi:hypothetical protein